MKIFILVMVFLLTLMIVGGVILRKRDKKKDKSKPSKSREELAKEEFEDRILTLSNNKYKNQNMATIFWYKENVDKFIMYVVREYNLSKNNIVVEELDKFTKVGVFWKL